VLRTWRSRYIGRATDRRKTGLISDFFNQRNLRLIIFFYFLSVFSVASFDYAQDGVCGFEKSGLTGQKEKGL